MARSLPVAEFLSAAGVVLDVRSPGEYEQGHIPGAISFPLFTNDERAQVGTCYKQQGRDQAVELGFEIAGPKCAEFVKRAKELSPDRAVRVHCWRGGMRSEAVAWILAMAGLQVCVLQGGYKTFRRWVRSTLATQKPIWILGGMTGSGKTDVLQAMAERAQVLDLEALASHRGSSFGSLCLPAQPTNEQFENEVAIEWAKLSPDQRIWIEAESKRIGTCRIPPELFEQMERSTVIEMICSRGERLDRLVDVYGAAETDSLIAATRRIGKRLGGLRTQQAIDHLQQRQLVPACDIILDYYDKTYTYDLQRRKVPIHSVEVAGLAASSAAEKLLAAADRLEMAQLPVATVGS